MAGFTTRKQLKCKCFVTNCKCANDAKSGACYSCTMGNHQVPEGK